MVTRARVLAWPARLDPGGSLARLDPACAPERFAPLVLLLLASACIPAPSGECARDADCAANGAGFFCAEGVCQGPPLAALDVPAGPFARNGTAAITVHVSRAHGGPAHASASLHAGGQTLATAQPQSDGSLRIDAPLSFAPAGAEGNAAFTVVVGDDLGHALSLPGALLVDDEGPRIALDPSSVPTAAVLRGAHASLRVLLTDEAASTLESSIGASAPVAASKQTDGSFRVDLDTALAPLDAMTLTATLAARDALGNTTQRNVVIPITRLRWRAASTDGAPIVGLVLTPTTLIATTGLGGFIEIDRAGGTRTQVALAGVTPKGNLILDDSAAYTSMNDGRICKLGFDGSIKWCCTPPAQLAGTIAVGSFPAAPPSTAMVSTVIATTRPGTSAGRLLAVGEVDPSTCDLHASPATASFLASGPIISPDGIVFAGAAQAAVAAQFDGLAWNAQSFARSPFIPSGEPAFVTTAGAGGARVIFGSAFGELDELSFAGATDGGLPASMTAQFATQASPAMVSSSAPIVAEDGTAIVATYDPLLVALSPDGGVRWSAPLAGQLVGAPVAGAGGIIYAAEAQGALDAFSLADGGVLWRYQTDAPLATAPAPGCDGFLYLGATSGEILSLAIDAPGLADSPWPREGHDVRGSGDARRALRLPDGGCAE